MDDNLKREIVVPLAKQIFAAAAGHFLSNGKEEQILFKPLEEHLAALAEDSIDAGEIMAQAQIKYVENRDE